MEKITVTVEKPMQHDLNGIKAVLSQWTYEREVKKHLSRIEDEFYGKTRYGMRFWVAKKGNAVYGVAGIAEPLPKSLPFSKEKHPAELKLLYVHGKFQGKGVGRTLIGFIEREAEKAGYDEILVRSAERYSPTYGFYIHMGYTKAGSMGEEPEKKMAVFEKSI